MKLEDFTDMVETRLKSENGNATEKSFLLEAYKFAEELKEMKQADDKENQNQAEAKTNKTERNDVEPKVATIFDYAKFKRKYCGWGKSCIDCPLFYDNNGENISCDSFITRHTEKANDIILEYIAKHPVKTYRQNFIEKFPNADISKLCIEAVYGKSRQELGIDNECDGCSKCWDSPMPDE